MGSDHKNDHGYKPARKSFLHRLVRLSLKNMVKSLDICREFKVELLLLCVKSCQLRLFRQIRMPP